MRTIKHKLSAPPGGWKYIHMDYEIIASSRNELLAKVRKHMEVNGDKIPHNLSSVIEDQICARIPERFCTGHDPKNLNLSVRDLYNGTRQIIDIVAKGKNAYVSDEEAEQRAKECSGCQYNLPYKTGCAKCRIVYTLVSSIVRRMPTKYDGKLGVCFLCKCLNKAQVHVKGDILKRINIPLDKYPNCWKRRLWNEP